ILRLYLGQPARPNSRSPVGSCRRPALRPPPTRRPRAAAGLAPRKPHTAAVPPSPGTPPESPDPHRIHHTRTLRPLQSPAAALPLTGSRLRGLGKRSGRPHAHPLARRLITAHVLIGHSVYFPSRFCKTISLTPSFGPWWIERGSPANGTLNARASMLSLQPIA